MEKYLLAPDLSSIADTLTGIPLAAKLVVMGIAIVSFCAGGVMMMGGERSKEKGKSHVAWVLIGVGVFCTGATIITWAFGAMG